MVHLLIIYQVLLMLLAVTVLVLVSILKTKIEYLRPFFKSYLFFTLLIFLDFLMTYSRSNVIIIPNLTSYYIYIALLSALFYLFYYYLQNSFHSFFNIESKKINLGIKVSLLLSFLFVMSPLSIVISKDLTTLNIKRFYYISFLPYIFTSLYIVLLIVQKLRIRSIKEEERLYIFPLSFFSIVCFFQAIYSYYLKIINPAITIELEYSERGFLESNIYFIILSIFIIIFCTKNITAKNRIPDISHFSSLGLTPRESEISILIAKDLSNKEITDELNISGSTLKTHINNIFKKTNVTSRRDFIKSVCNIS